MQSGHRIAHNFKKLEQLALATGVEPLSSLDFSPIPIRLKSLRWNDPRKGLNVISALNKLVEERPSEFADPEELSMELQKILIALHLCVAREIRFTMIRKPDNGSSELLWEDGGGSANL